MFPLCLPSPLSSPPLPSPPPFVTHLAYGGFTQQDQLDAAAGLGRVAFTHWCVVLVEWVCAPSQGNEKGLGVFGVEAVLSGDAAVVRAAGGKDDGLG